MTTMEQVAQLLAAHRAAPCYRDGYYISGYGCICDEFVGDSDEEHDAHVAQRLKDAGVLIVDSDWEEAQTPAQVRTETRRRLGYPTDQGDPVVNRIVEKLYGESE